jgi:ABC-2 type transport system permease protein
MLILAGIIVLSSFVSGLFALFKSEGMAWIIVSPEYKSFPRFVYIKTLLGSSWPLLVLFVPAILAFTKVFTLPYYGIVLMIIGVLLTLVSLNALTLLSILILAHIYRYILRLFGKMILTFKGLIAFIVLVVTLIGVYLWKSVGYIDIVKLFRAEETDVVIPLTTIANHFAMFLTHPFAMFLVLFQFGDHVGAYTYVLILALITLGGIGLWWYLSPSWYILWKLLQDGGAPLDTTTAKRQTPLVGYTFNGTPLQALFKKEFLISSRNLRGVMWFIFLFGIWVSQILASVILNKNVILYQTDLSPKMITLQILQYMIALYFICSFTLRFVFTSFSIEKNTRWILASAPLSIRKIFLGKYFFYSTFFIILGLLMGYGSVLALGITLTHGFYLVTLFLTTLIAVVTFGLSMGALYPSFETDDPEIISTSMPGLIFTGIALLYSALSAYVLYLMLVKDLALLLPLYILITLAIVVYLIKKVFSTAHLHYAQ